MKYQILEYKSIDRVLKNVNTTIDDVTFTQFLAEVGNPNYDQFLVDAKLTDKQVKELKPDVWYDFPEGDK
jgi:hypothetical protein